MARKRISLDNAEKDKLFYFVTTIVVYRESDRRCLILKRDMKDDVYPGKWALPGGKLAWDDFNLSKPDMKSNGILNFNRPLEKQVAVIVKEKAGIEVGSRPQYLESVFFVRPDGTPSVLVRFGARYLGGEVKPKAGFTDFAWVNEEEIKKYDHIEDIDMDVLKTIKLFS
ncbi:hypothetical protein HYW58_00835 [Candidatus Kaiserbacteria bacterium]|nr:hypothetical protein [Candidatus Kaiserbacteria bacterium]